MLQQLHGRFPTLCMPSSARFVKFLPIVVVKKSEVMGKVTGKSYWGRDFSNQLGQLATAARFQGLGFYTAPHRST